MPDQRDHNNRKRRRQDSDQDLSTPASSAMSQSRGSREPSADGPDTILDPGFDQVPASNNVYPPSDHRAGSANLSYIAECITQLSHDDVQQLLADAATRHQDIFVALQTKAQEVELTRQGDKARIERHLMNTYIPDQYYHDTSRAISTQLDAIEQADIPDEPFEEGQDDELRFGVYASEVQYILDEKWAHIKPSSQLKKIGHATNDIMGIVDEGIINKLGHNSDYNMKATALLNLFAVAEALTESLGIFADRVRFAVMDHGFCEKLLGMVHRLDRKEMSRFVQNEVCLDYLSDIFSESSTSQSSSLIIARIRPTIVDLRLWARQAVLAQPILQGMS